MNWRVDYSYGWQLAADDEEANYEHSQLRWLRFDVPPDSAIRRVLLHRVSGVRAVNAYALALRLSDGASSWRCALPGRSLARLLSSDMPTWWRYLAPRPHTMPRFMSRIIAAEEACFVGLEVLEVLVDCDGVALGSPSRPTCTIAFESCRLADAPEPGWKSSNCPLVHFLRSRPFDPVLQEVAIRGVRRVAS